MRTQDEGLPARPQVSVVTTVHPGRAEHLVQAWASLRAQTGPAWEWLVQVDGPGPVDTPSDDRVHVVHNPRTLGPAVSRNLAAARASAPVLTVLDGDDELTPGRLARDLAVLTAHDDVAWVTSAAQDVPGGVPPGPAAGRIPRGDLFAHWTSHDHRLLVHPATLTVRTAPFWAAGGWMALPASEDTGLLLALSTVRDGWFDATVGLRYRRWPGQLTAQPEHAEAALRHRAITARVHALGG